MVNHGGCRPFTAAGGFTYILVLLIVALMSIGLAVIGEQWANSSRRQLDAELEWVGEQYVLAIGSYYHATPGASKTYPPSLEALLLDVRFPFVRRHLRRLYVNAQTRALDWELVRAPGGGVMGVAHGRHGENTVGRLFVYRPPSAAEPMSQR